ncbi:hypothetical protein AB0K09_00585 [Streptomyces sp. NPDC049577]
MPKIEEIPDAEATVAESPDDFATRCVPLTRLDRRRLAGRGGSRI